VGGRYLEGGGHHGAHRTARQQEDHREDDEEDHDPETAPLPQSRHEENLGSGPLLDKGPLRHDRSMAKTPPRGRYAPSPTGDLHLGNASAALLAWLSVRSQGGAFVMRLEDLDRPRVRPGAAERILADLRWLGLDWDEADRGGAHAPYDQGSRTGLYEAAFRKLRDLGCVYPCFCSRRDIAAAASAPQAPGDEVRYPGTCRALTEEEARKRMSRGDPHAWRYRGEDAGSPTFVDLVHGTWPVEAVAPGDFVVRRADGVAAYQLAVVVDDAEMGITEVVRGEDLLPSTPRQILLYRSLGLAEPVFGHVPLLVGTDGVRLSKRHLGTTLAELRAAGLGAEGGGGSRSWRGWRRAAAQRRVADPGSTGALRCAAADGDRPDGLARAPP
jgi:glutamyl-tRNA synthetase